MTNNKTTLGDFQSETDDETETDTTATPSTTARDPRPSPPAHNERNINNLLNGDTDDQDTEGDRVQVPAATVTITKAKLKALAYTVKNHAVDALCSITETGVELKAVDSANVALFECKLDRDDLVSYAPETHGETGLPVDDLYDVSREIDRKHVSLELLPDENSDDDNDDVGTIQINNSHTLPMNSASTVRSPNLPDLEIAATATVPSNEFRRALDTVSELSTNTTITWGKDRLHFHADGDTDNTHVETASTTQRREAHSCYSLEYLSELSRPLKRYGSNTITIAHSGTDDDNQNQDPGKPVTNSPTVIAYELNGIQCRTMIAPRVQTDGELTHRVQPALKIPGANDLTGPQHDARYNLPEVDDAILSSDRDDIIKSLKPLTAKTSEVKIQITENGIDAAVVDPSNVCSSHVNLPGPEITNWEYNDEITLGVNLDRLLTVLEQFPEHTTVSISHDPDSRQLAIAGAGTTFNLALIDPDSIRRTPDVPELTHSARALVSRNELEDAINDVGADHATFTTQNGQLYVHSDEDDDESIINSVRCFNGKGHAQSKYSTEYLNDILDVLDQGTVEIVMANEAPILIQSKNSVFMLAPRVINDDDPDVLGAELLEQVNVNGEALTEQPDKQFKTQPGPRTHSIELCEIQPETNEEIPDTKPKTPADD